MLTFKLWIACLLGWAVVGNLNIWPNTKILKPRAAPRDVISDREREPKVVRQLEGSKRKRSPGGSFSDDRSQPMLFCKLRDNLGATDGVLVYQKNHLAVKRLTL